MELLKMGLIGIVTAIIILVCISVLRKTNPNPSRLEELKELGGHTYQSMTNIAIAVLGIGVVGCVIGIISYFI